MGQRTLPKGRQGTKRHVPAYSWIVPCLRRQETKQETLPWQPGCTLSRLMGQRTQPKGRQGTKRHVPAYSWRQETLALANYNVLCLGQTEAKDRGQAQGPDRECKTGNVKHVYSQSVNLQSVNVWHSLQSSLPDCQEFPLVWSGLENRKLANFRQLSRLG